MSTITVPKDDPLQHATAALTAAGIAISDTRDIAHGWQVRGVGGEILNVYATGKVVVQGRNAQAIHAAFAQYRPPSPATVPAVTPARRPAPIKAASVAPDVVDVVEHTPRRPANWSDEPWDGVTPPF